MDDVDEAREAIETYVEAGGPKELTNHRKRRLTGTKRKCKELRTQSSMVVTLIEKEYKAMIDMTAEYSSLFRPVGAEAYNPEKEDNIFINDYAARLPKWVVRVLMADDTAPMDFLHRVTVDDLRATSGLLRAIVETAAFKEDARVMERVTQEMDGMEGMALTDHHFDSQLWVWVARILLTQVATRFVMGDLLQLNQRKEGTLAKPRSVKGSRYHADLLHWSVTPTKPTHFSVFPFRLGLLGNPGWVRTLRTVPGSGCGRHGPRVTQQIPRHHMLHCMVETMLRVGSADYTTPLQMSARSYRSAPVKLQSTMMVVPTTSTMAERSTDVGIYVNPIITFLPCHCTSALRSFMSTRDLTGAFKHLPLLSERVALATERAFATRLPDIYSLRMVLGCNIDSSTSDKTIRLAPEPLFSHRNESQRSSVSVVTQRHVNENYRQLARNLAAFSSPSNRIVSKEPTAVGAVPLHLGSPGWDQGLFDCFLGPVVEFCRHVYGPCGFRAFSRKAATQQSVDGAGDWVFEPKAPFGAETADDAYAKVHKDALEAAKIYFEEELWDARSGEREGGERKRRRMEEVQLPRQVHLGAVQARVRWSRPGRRGGPPLPHNHVDVKTRYGNVAVQAEWCERVEGE